MLSFLKWIVKRKKRSLTTYKKKKLWPMIVMEHELVLLLGSKDPTQAANVYEVAREGTPFAKNPPRRRFR